MGLEPFRTRLRDWHARGRTWPALLAVAVIAVLAQGALERRRVPDERGGATAPGTTASSAPVPLLRPDLEAVPLSYMSDYWLQLGQRVRRRIALVGGRRVPALVLAPRLALTSLAALDARDGEPRVVGVDLDLGLALVELPGEAPPPPLVAADPASLRPGALIAAVTVDAQARLRIASGQLVALPTGAGELETTASLPGSSAATALVDLEGRLVGGAFTTASGVRQLSAGALQATLERLRAAPGCSPLELGDLDRSVRRLLHIEHGAVVELVRGEAFASEPALRAGDVLLSWRGERVRDAATARALVAGDAPGARVAYVVLRGGARVRGTTLAPGRDCRVVPDAPRTYARLGLTLERDSGGTRVVDVAAGGLAARAGVAPDDRVVAVAGRSPGTSAAQAALDAFERRPGALVLSVQTGQRVRLVAVTAPRE